MKNLSPKGEENTLAYKLIPHGGTVTGTGEVIVAQLTIPANVWAVGSTIEFFCTDHNTTTNSTVTYRVRIGSAGTTSDAAVQQFSTTPAIQTTTTTHGTTTGTVAGASAAHVGNSFYINAAGNAGQSGNTAATSTFNSTIVNIFSLTAQNGTSVTRTIRGGYIRISHP